MRFAVPLPPSVNHLYHIVVAGRPRLVKTHEARRWQDAVGWEARRACRAAQWRMRTGEEKVVVALWAEWPDRRRRDMSNLHKLLADALEGVVYEDDRQALLRDMDWTVKPPGRLVVEVRDV